MPNKVDEVRFRTERVRLESDSIDVVFNSSGTGSSPSFGDGVGGLVELPETGVMSKARRGMGRRRGDGSVISRENSKTLLPIVLRSASSVRSDSCWQLPEA